MKFFAVLIFIFVCSNAIAKREISTITVKYADPQLLLTAIEPLLSEQSTISIYQNQLILNVKEEELEKIQGLLRSIDQPSQQLLISLKKTDGSSNNNSALRVDGTFSTGNSTITTNTKKNSTSVRITSSRGVSEGTGNQSVRATEGRPAFIGTGTSVPLIQNTPHNQTYQQTYVDAVSGFYATAWVNGEQVSITIDQSDDSISGKAISTQQLQTRVSGVIGEWLYIGMINESRRQKHKNLTGGGSGLTSQSTQLYIKVDLL